MKWPFIVARDKFQKTLDYNRYTPIKHSYIFISYIFIPLLVIPFMRSRGDHSYPKTLKPLYINAFRHLYLHCDPQPYIKNLYTFDCYHINFSYMCLCEMGRHKIFISVRANEFSMLSASYGCDRTLRSCPRRSSDKPQKYPKPLLYKDYRQLTN